ncbi:hypothetical protein E2562_035174 [Oryza meyeriana var. granulata]|uniref:Uncharacterized protein n=1 Tax=Oryza meyeriana var. granulata TaxID=110450 RepID=A0A6G1C9F9_9ORYZ|nr:hypothetical protein E2562_035174 [Oryza meyeriana var. granulata]
MLTGTEPGRGRGGVDGGRALFAVPRLFVGLDGGEPTSPLHPKSPWMPRMWDSELVWLVLVKAKSFVGVVL